MFIMRLAKEELYIAELPKGCLLEHSIKGRDVELANRTLRALHNEISAERKLTHIDVEITKNCNLRCVHCSARSNVAGRELSLNEIKTVLNNASSLGLENVGFTGGEPLLRRNKLMALLEYCKHDLDLKTHLHTNGTLIKLEDAAIMAKFVNETTIPFLGSNPKTHDKITLVAGSFKAAEEGLVRLVRQHARITTFIVPMKQNFKEIPEIIKNVCENGCDRFRILSLSPTGRAIDQFETLFVDSNDVEWLTNELVKAQEVLGVDIDAGFCTRQDYPRLGELHGHQSCLAAENRIHIDALGEVFPCTASSGWQSFSAGNLRRNAFNLSDIWQHSPVLQFFRYFHSNPPQKCRHCSIYQECMGGCRVVMYYKYGDITIAKPNCKSPE